MIFLSFENLLENKALKPLIPSAEEIFGEGSINFGVEGNAGGNAWNNTGLEGSNFGGEGLWNSRARQIERNLGYD